MSAFLATFKQDCVRNRVSAKSLFIVIAFRMSSAIAQHPVAAVRLFGLPVRLMYRICVELLLCIELPDRVKAGPGLAVFHGAGLVVNAATRLGANVTLRQCTTIGAKGADEAAPEIGDNVSVGANVVILGPITVGAGSRIGAGAVLVESCPPGCVVYAAKARISPATLAGSG